MGFFDTDRWARAAADYSPQPPEYAVGSVQRPPFVIQLSSLDWVRLKHVLGNDAVEHSDREFSHGRVVFQRQFAGDPDETQRELDRATLLAMTASEAAVADAARREGMRKVGEWLADKAEKARLFHGEAADTSLTAKAYHNGAEQVKYWLGKEREAIELNQD